MIKILFICHGNICRSPMAEFMLKEKLRQNKLEHLFFVESKATSKEELGSDIHYGTKRKLEEMHIPYTKHIATQIEPNDYNKYDYFICMDQANIRNTLRIFNDDPQKKIFRLLDITSTPKDIADPWYTDNFDETYDDLDYGLDKLIQLLTKR